MHCSLSCVQWASSIFLMGEQGKAATHAVLLAMVSSDCCSHCPVFLDAVTSVTLEEKR